MEQSRDPAAGQGGGFRSPGHSWSRHLHSLSSGCCREQPVSVHSAAAWQWLLSFGIGLSEAKFGSCLSAGSVGGSLPGAPLPAVPAAPERMLWEAIGVSALISRGVWSTQGRLWQGRWEFLFLDLLPLCLRWCLSCSLSLGGDFFQDCVTPSLAHPLCCDWGYYSAVGMKRGLEHLPYQHRLRVEPGEVGRP